ncbi:hypothetical protein [Brevibacterium otitidis]|uniref:Uncharacterized protein n=1 Tax=Brevibacterium otitidis TaxID=53364 RepID=A0ABV5WZK3_9MICO|nr:hypothetical protein GCM10023233_13490 [Brevibacterium otitidis]
MSSSSDDEHGSDDGRTDPTWDSLGDGERVADDEWSELVSGINRDYGFVPEMSADEIRDALAEDEEWHPPEPAPVGWRTAPPLFVLGLLGLIGGIIALLLSAFILRALPGFVLAVIIVVILLSTVIVIRHLPEHRSPDDGDGAQV